MKDQETRQKFVDLRARGRSFARISEEFQVSKRTLIEWRRRFQFEIKNQRVIELEELRERYLAGREEQARQLRDVEAKLATRNVSELSTPRLFTLAGALRRQLVHATGGELRLSTTVQSIPGDEYQDEAQDWTP